MDRATRLKRLHFRAWHRGTREADMMIGGFFVANADTWADSDLDWFDTLLEYDDVDIMAWAIGRQTPPDAIEGPQMDAMRKLDFIDLPK